MKTRLIVAGLTGLILVGCSSSDAGPSEHTLNSLYEAVSVLNDEGWDCEPREFQDQSSAIYCKATGETEFDTNTNIYLVVDTLNIENTREAYRAIADNCSKTAEESGDTAPYELYKDDYLVIGKNWFQFLAIPKRNDAERLAEITGGTVYSFPEFCDDPPPLRDFGD